MLELETIGAKSECLPKQKCLHQIGVSYTYISEYHSDYEFPRTTAGHSPEEIPLIMTIEGTNDRASKASIP